MTARDYLWCAVHLLLDQEELTNQLCPSCRARAEIPQCPMCGAPVGEREENPTFDLDRFEQLRRKEGT